MKKIFLAIFSTAFIFSVSSAQILNKVKDKIKQASEAKSSVPANSGNTQENPQQTGVVTTEETNETNNNNNLTYTSKYDFVSGEKVVAYEDFNNAAVGDFPTRWNTNATAEVVSLNNKEGKWLKLNKEGTFHPEFITNLPDNFTLEFDLGINNGWNSYPFILNIAKLKSPENFTDYNHYVSWQGDHAIHLEFLPGRDGARGRSDVLAGKDGNHTINNNVEFSGWDNSSKNFAHIAIWRQNQRLRVYVNGEKVWDLPRAFDATSKFNAITFANHTSYVDEDFYVLGNIRLAVGAPDTRNKLITEGKFVTSGIYFDVASDKLKPDSYGVLKEIAAVLKENEGVKIKIVGHTDSDGDDTKNLELSKKRAASVKKALETTFGIAASRIETDGKGETAPLTKNDTQEGKAQNRRVEFIKL